MRDIETEIETLKAQIAMLEKEQTLNHIHIDDDWGESYFVEKGHVILRDSRVSNYDSSILAVIVDEAAVRKYITDKDNLASLVAA